MKFQKLNSKGFTHDVILMLFVGIFAIAGVAYLVGSHAATLNSAQFSGVITQDECATTTAPIGDVGCHITVGTKVVSVAHGNIAQNAPWGQVIGFGSIKTNYTGRTVQVYAAENNPTSYTLKGSSSYYVKLVTYPSVKFTGVITQDECATTTAPIGDVGCHVMVSNSTVYLMHGNIYQPQPWGQVIGFGSIRTNYVGRYLQVYAAKLNASTYTLMGSSSYYAQLLKTPSGGIVPGSNCVPTSTTACPL